VETARKVEKPSDSKCIVWEGREWEWEYSMGNGMGMGMGIVWEWMEWKREYGMDMEWRERERMERWREIVWNGEEKRENGIWNGIVWKREREYGWIWID
jgi:hypothetical protein